MTKAEARNIYRDAWQGFVLAKTKKERDMFEELMDSVQDFCTDPDQYAGDEWREFIHTLPGFENYWKGIIADLEALVAKFDKK